MRCSASPTTCIAPKTGIAERAAVGSRAKEAASQFEAMLFSKALAPVAKAMGFYGDLVVAAATHAMTARCDDAFARALVREAEGSA